jgi:DNA segregation ATPase FtsK/SpoIIIE-like protein
MKMRNIDKRLLKKAKKIVIENNNASISFVQRKLMIGYNKSARLIEELEKIGLVSSLNPKEFRRVVYVKKFQRAKKFTCKHKSQKSNLLNFERVKPSL